MKKDTRCCHIYVKVGQYTGNRNKERVSTMKRKALAIALPKWMRPFAGILLQLEPKFHLIERFFVKVK